MLLQHIDRIAHWLAVLDDGGAGKRSCIHEFLYQINRCAVIPEKLSLPLMRLFGQQRIELPGSQLPQVYDLHAMRFHPTCGHATNLSIIFREGFTLHGSPSAAER